MKNLTACIILFFSIMIALVSPVSAQAVLFDFDNAPIHSNLPIYQTSGGITAHLSGTATGYSIQDANALGFIPQGFSGRIIYPNSINIADLLVHFDQKITDFSIMCCTQELACDDAATVRVTAYSNGILVGYADRMAICLCTWPVDTLMYSFPQGFDSVVVHYQHAPLTCQDYGVVLLFDNMRVTPFILSVISEGEILKMFELKQNYPNPFNPSTDIEFSIPRNSFVRLEIFDVTGQSIEILLNKNMEAGIYKTDFDGTKLSSGIYFYTLTAGDFTDSKKMILVK